MCSKKKPLPLVILVSTVSFMILVLMMSLDIKDVAAMASRKTLEDLIPDGLFMENPTVSADNKYVLLSVAYYKDGGGTKQTLILYNITNDSFAAFPLSRKISWSKGVFSPDGRYLAVVGQCDNHCPDGWLGRHVALVDFQSQRPAASNVDVPYWLLKRGVAYQKSPTFSSDGTSLYFASYEPMFFDGYYSPKSSPRIVRQSIGDASAEDILTGELPLDSIDKIHVLSDQDSFIIQGSYPYKDMITMQEEGRLGRANFIVPVYLPKNHQPILLTESKKFPWAHNFTDIEKISVSPGGQIFFVYHDLDEIMDPKTGTFNYDFYVADGGVVRQLTHLKTMVYQFTLSPDGSMIAALLDEKKRSLNDLWLIDSHSGKARSVHLRRRLLKAIRQELGFE